MSDIFPRGSELLVRSGVKDPEVKLTELIAFVTGLDYSQIRLKRLTGSLSLSTEEEERLFSLLQRLIAGEPLQYITGYTDFYGLVFHTRKGVLIPRFDTECVVDAVLSSLPENGRVLDLCTGSGCIGITLAVRGGAVAVCADISPEALALAEENAGLMKVQDRVKVVRHDILRDDPKSLGLFDCVVSNPPYIPSGNISSLDAEVKNEPSLALDGGKDGLDFYRAIVSRYVGCLRPGGTVTVECGIGQHEQIALLFAEAGLPEIRFGKDLGGIVRAVSAKV